MLGALRIADEMSTMFMHRYFKGDESPNLLQRWRKWNRIYLLLIDKQMEINWRKLEVLANV